MPDEVSVASPGRRGARREYAPVLSHRLDDNGLRHTMWQRSSLAVTSRHRATHCGSRRGFGRGGRSQRFDLAGMVDRLAG